MKLKKININNWNRKEYFEHYFSNIPCTYSMTIKLDITKIKSKNIKLYPTMLYYITNIVNKHDEFKTAFNENGELGIYDEMIPCYTIFHKDTKTFSNIWTRYTSNINDFYAEYENDLKQYGNKKELNAKSNTPSNTFNVSMIPWTTFESFNLNLQKGYTYLSPIFTLGKYYKEDDKFLIPLSIQVHHAICDGFHVCQFLNELQDLINK
ncbi:type A chloramphenicol O-acetyltransferase [Anaerofustis butyriciformans]|uniref:type A chloramphenicol O-acetyltransferase n=1 Tax=Anaerofustis butyriciformans TaxID=3108533 RepID=UPI002E2FDB7D|nr:type A chloramphenicol O-acetyltransferase [Anaerofustis sp. HA2171]